MHSYCLNFIPHLFPNLLFSTFLAGPIEIGLLLCTPSIPENEMNRMHYIPLGRDVEQGDLPSFYKWYQIRERKVCQLWNYWSSGSFLFLLTGREPQRLWAIEEERMGRYLAQHVFPVSHLPVPFHQLLRTVLPRLIVFPPPLMKAGIEIVIKPHRGGELYLQADSSEGHSTLNVFLSFCSSDDGFMNFMIVKICIVCQSLPLAFTFRLW